MASTRKVQLTQHPLCCGIYLMNDLLRNFVPWDLDRYRRNVTGSMSSTQEQCDAWNAAQGAETDEEYKTRIDTQVGDYVKAYKKKKSYFLCVLNVKEIEYGAEEILLKHGFEVVIPHTRNPTGSGITMYACHLLPKEGREKPRESIFGAVAAPAVAPVVPPDTVINIAPRAA